MLGFCSFLFYFLLLLFFLCANNHLNNVTAVEEGDTFFFCGLLHISSTHRSLILISVAVTLPNEKVIRLKCAKIYLCQVAKIDRRLYVEGGEGGASLCPAPTIQTPVKFGGIEEFFIR